MKVKYLPLQPHCFAFGGFEIQMLHTLKAVQDAGVCAGKLDVWSREKDFEILHVWGLDQAHYNTVSWAKKAGVKIVVTALLPYIENSYAKIRNMLFSRIGNEKYMRKICRLADAVVLVNEIQRQVAIDHFKTDPSKAYAIPNVVSDVYFSPKPGIFSKKFKVENYVLIAGNICRRKNQVQLAQACIVNNYNLVIIGDVLEGEEDYASRLQKMIEGRRNVLWLKGLEPGSDDLANAFFDCALFALPSYVEQQPISALEAVACRKPLLLADRSYAKQMYYENCVRVNPDSVDSISDGISRILKSGYVKITPFSIIEQCRITQVGKKYSDVYERILLPNT